MQRGLVAQKSHLRGQPNVDGPDFPLGVERRCGQSGQVAFAREHCARGADELVLGRMQSLDDCHVSLDKRARTQELQVAQVFASFFIDDLGHARMVRLPVDGGAA